MGDLAVYPRIKGKNVIITGASAGIGKASAIHFAACGSNLLLLARRVDRLAKLKKELVSNHNVIVHVAKVDVSDRQDWDNFSKNIPEPFKSSPDILINNAGKALGGMKKVFEFDWTDANDMIEVNIKGVILVTQTFVPIMKTRGMGHIVNLSSIAGKQAYVNGGIYCATKFALEALSDSLRLELVDTPIRVTKISPGLVNTEFSTVRLGNKTAADKVYDGLTPLLAEDIADQILYVCSRPEHVQIADILVFPTSQASATVVHRNPSKL